MSEIDAYHEAGHAFAAVVVGARVVQVSIDPDAHDGPQRSGEATIEWNRRLYRADEIAEAQILVCLAGPIAEMIYSGDPLHPGTVPEWSQDWSVAWQLAAPIHSDRKNRLQFLEQRTVQAYQSLYEDRRWAGIAAIADHLLAYESIEGETVHEVVESCCG